MPKFAATIALTVALAFALTACGAPSPAMGKAIFYVSDAAAEMGAVSSVQITVDSLRVHSQGGAWTTVSTNAQSYDLLALKAAGAGKLLAQADLQAGTYDQVELNVSKVIVVDAQGSHEAKLPSSKLQVKTVMEVKAGTTATANFDFIADESLHITGECKYILAPVVQTETRSNAEVQVAANNEVRVSGGKGVAQVRVGMDAEGNVGTGLQVSPNAVLSIEASGKVIQVKGQASATGTVKAVDTTAGTVTITTKDGGDLVLRLSTDSRLVVDGSGSTLAGLKGKIGAKTRIQYDVNTKVVTNAVVTASGVVKAVNVAIGTVTIATDNQGDVTLNIASNTKIVVGGTVSTLGTLATKIGSRVTLEYDANTKVATSINVQAQTQANISVSGTLKAVNPLAQTITITTETGADVVLKMTPNTKLQVRGLVSTLLSLATNIGSKVSVEYDAETKTVISVNVQG